LPTQAWSSNALRRKRRHADGAARPRRTDQPLGAWHCKRFCRGFGFELQAAANEEDRHLARAASQLPLADVFDFLHPNSVKEILTQAVLDQPMFESRWR
jgi:hypothetical protein